MNIGLMFPTAGLTCEVQFTEHQMQEIFKLQAEANDVMSDEWRASTNDQIPYYRASWLEAAECLMHIGYKWWKKEEMDREQSILEVVDTMHFAASDYIRKGFAPPVNVQVKNMLEIRDHTNTIALDRKAWRGDIRDLIEQAAAHMIMTQSVDWSWICMIAQALEVTAEELYQKYLGKNVLNKFRTAHGQREGEYRKIWDGKEDNVYLVELLDINPEITAEQLHEALGEIYEDMLENELAVKG